MILWICACGWRMVVWRATWWVSSGCVHTGVRYGYDYGYGYTNGKIEAVRCGPRTPIFIIFYIWLLCYDCDYSAWFSVDSIAKSEAVRCGPRTPDKFWIKRYYWNKNFVWIWGRGLLGVLPQFSSLLIMIVAYIRVWCVYIYYYIYKYDVWCMWLRLHFINMILTYSVRSDSPQLFFRIIIRLDTLSLHRLLLHRLTDVCFISLLCILSRRCSRTIWVWVYFGLSCVDNYFIYLLKCANIITLLLYCVVCSVRFQLVCCRAGNSCSRVINVLTRLWHEHD